MAPFLSHLPEQTEQQATRKPELWLDGRNVGRPGGTGVHHYAINHYQLMQQSGLSPSWLLEESDTTPPRVPAWRFLQALHAHSPPVGPAFPSPWGPARLARDLYRIAHVHYRHHKRLLPVWPDTPPAIMHWTCPLPLYMEGARNLVTIHDLIPLTHPHLTGIDPGRFHRLIQDLSNRDVHFVTVSETVRQQVLAWFSLPASRVTTLYQSVDFSQETRQAISTTPRIAPAGSFIFYGRVEHRKNLERLVAAHARSKSATPLVIIGPDGDDRPDCTARAPHSTIIRLPWSDRLSLLRCLSEARALLFPSLAEGFGLPIIEAMALGIPVLTSQGGVTGEIAADAALLCDPTNISALASAIAHLDKLPLAERKHMQAKGHERARHFSAPVHQQRLHHFYAAMLHSRA